MGLYPVPNPSSNHPSQTTWPSTVTEKMESLIRRTTLSQYEHLYRAPLLQAPPDYLHTQACFTRQDLHLLSTFILTFISLLCPMYYSRPDPYPYLTFKLSCSCTLQGLSVEFCSPSLNISDNCPGNSTTVLDFHLKEYIIPGSWWALHFKCQRLCHLSSSKALTVLCSINFLSGK